MLVKQVCKRSSFFCPPALSPLCCKERQGPVEYLCWEQCLEAPLELLGRMEAVGGALPGGISSLPEPGLGQRTVLMPCTLQTRCEQGEQQPCRQDCGTAPA